MNDPKTKKHVEEAVNALFKQYDIQEKAHLDDIKKWIWNSTGGAMESSSRFQKKCLNLFPPAESIDEMNDIMQVFVDAWNYFPHKVLDGKSPAEACQEAYGKNPEERFPSSKSKKEMPKVKVGDHEMEWDEFQLMIREMEKMQKPFKKWIEKEALPKYKKYLEQIVKGEKACEKHYEVADLFFQRVLHVGFIELKEIRPDFIRSEFPNWWPIHVMYSDLKPAAVKKSLELLLDFIELVYNVKI